MSDIGRFFGLGSTGDRGKGGNNRASVASSESDSASTVRVEHLVDTASARELMPPPPPPPIRIPSPPRSTSTAHFFSMEESEPAVASRPPPPQRTRSGVGIFKVPSYLSLRSNSTGSTSGGKHAKTGGASGGRGAGSADSSRAPTPMPGSGAQETASSLSWLDFSRRGNTRGASAGSAGSTSSNNLDSSSSSSVLPPPVLIPSPHTADSSSLSLNAASSSSSSAPVAVAASAAALAAAAARNKKWANTFVPMEAEENSLVMPKSSNSSFSWHRPSLLQVVESLQVAILSKETAGANPYSAPPLSSSTVSLSRRRSSANKASQPIVPTGQSDAIPGRFRSHISYLLEGVQMLQDMLDKAELRATESERALQEALGQFAELSDEWLVRERQLTQELQQLRERNRAEKTGPMLAAESTTESSSEGDLAPAPSDFSTRIKEAIRASETVLCKEGNDNAASNKRTTLPALICDLDHDKAISDQLLKTMAATEQKSRSRARRGPKLDPLLTASKADISMAQQAVIEDLQQSMQHDSRDESSNEKAPPKKKKTRRRKVRAAAQGGDGHISNASPGSPVPDVSPSGSISRAYFANFPASPGLSTNILGLSSSSSSDPEEYPWMYQPKATMLQDTEQVGDRDTLFAMDQGVQGENAEVTSPAGSPQ